MSYDGLPLTPPLFGRAVCPGAGGAHATHQVKRRLKYRFGRRPPQAGAATGRSLGVQPVAGSQFRVRLGGPPPTRRRIHPRVRAFTRLLLPNGTSVELGHGDIIGRLWSAALSIPDARVSEAHAMVSLRGQDLLLLALRGRFAMGGKVRNSLVLEAGQVISLVEGLELRVEEVSLPASIFAIEGEGLPRVAVTGVCSLLTRPRPELVPRLVPDAPVHIWGDGEGWCLSMNGVSRPIKPGDSWDVDGRRFAAVALSLDGAGRTATHLEGVVSHALRIVAKFDTVHIHPERSEPLALSGMAARTISEIVSFDGPVPWEVLARELWPDEDDVHLLRHKLDVTLSRVRARLREGGVRPDLVRSDGFGNVELFLHTGDQVEDRT